MKAKLVVFVIICISSLSLALALDTIEVQETELVDLQVSVNDPDNDQLSIFYTPPLNEEGLWQTTYGDAGSYDLTIRVSDGQLTSSKNVLLIVNKKNELPKFIAISPESEVRSREGQSITFSVQATDLNQDPLTYTWIRNGRTLDTSSSTVDFYTDYGDAGEHEMTVQVSDGSEQVSFTWTISVEEVDRAALLEGFQDITVTETETVRIQLPDLTQYNLEAEISAPLETGKWKTTYEDAGEYEITITLTDRDFEVQKTITLTVLNKDRVPEIKSVGVIFIDETDQVSFALDATDPDGDPITVTLANLPEGASFDGTTFSWQTDFDTVQKDSMIKKIVDKFHLLYYPFKLEFTAASNDLATTKTIFVWVKDINRPPELAELPNIQAVEGESLTITPQASDADGDKVTFTYAGWMTAPTITPDYDDAGKHVVQVTASDGFLKQTKDVIIEVADANRLPQAAIPSNLKVKENEELSFTITPRDPDKDPVSVRLIRPQQNMKLQENTLTWTPGYDFAKQDTVNITILLALNDGRDEVIIEVPVLVEHVNRAPFIKTIKPKTGSKGIAGRPVTFIVDAVDPDGDTLKYTWKFGVLEKYNSTAAMRRTFTSPGKKKVNVVVSDGQEKVEETWEIDMLRIVQRQPPAPQVTKNVQQKVVQPVPQPTQQDPKVFQQFTVVG